MSSLTPGPNDENGVHHHQNSRKTPVLSRSNQCQSESVGMDESGTGGGTGHLISSSLGSQSQDSLNNEQPRNKLLGKWHRTVKIGSTTKNFLHKLKSRSQSHTLDKSHSEENVLSESEMKDHSSNGGSGSDGKHSFSENINHSNGHTGNGTTKSTWSEHVWSTFIHRGYSDDVTEKPSVVVGRELLTDFQQDKFRYFFYHVLDLNSDHVISKEDFVKLNKRIKHYMDWSVNTIQFLALQEVHGSFLEDFLYTSSMIKSDQTQLITAWETCDPEENCCVTIDWLDVWGLLVGEAKKINDLPMWLQYYPKTLFDTINRSGSGVISKQELRLFYTAFLDVGTLGEEKISSITEESYKAMTSNGDVNLDFHIYKLSFLNFLLGKQPNGPGQYIFGSVVPKAGKQLFSVDYSALTKKEETEKETFTVETLLGYGERQRKSIIV